MNVLVLLLVPAAESIFRCKLWNLKLSGKYMIALLIYFLKFTSKNIFSNLTLCLLIPPPLCLTLSGEWIDPRSQWTSFHSSLSLTLLLTTVRYVSMSRRTKKKFCISITKYRQHLENWLSEHLMTSYFFYLNLNSIL